METKTVIEYDGFKGYYILINGEKAECNRLDCTCVVFGASGDDHICNACNNKLVIPDVICISCNEKIDSEDNDGVFDTDECGPYCDLCHGRLPKYLKGE